ncbi:MAG: GMC family oxidoreductase, partial [Elusimicrobiota bacterium]
GVYTPPELAAITMPLEGRRLKWWMDRFGHVATFGLMIQDESRGRIRYPLGPGYPYVRYIMIEADRRRMLRAIRTVAEVFFAAGAKKVLLPVNRKANEFDSARELGREDFSRARPQEIQMMAFHPLGTCAMGLVTDENLQISPGIFICDGSVVPESLGVNPQMTIYAFALRLAEHLLKETLA